MSAPLVLPEQQLLFPGQKRTISEKDARQTWGTPDPLYQGLCTEFLFDFDAAASSLNAKCERYWTAEDDALSKRWPRARYWVNPPYADILPWMTHALDTMQNEGSLVVLLVPASVATGWFHDVVAPHGEFWFFRGRVNFVPPPGIKKSTNDRDSMLVIFEPGRKPGFGGTRDNKTGLILEAKR